MSYIYKMSDKNDINSKGGSDIGKNGKREKWY